LQALDRFNPHGQAVWKSVEYIYSRFHFLSPASGEAVRMPRRQGCTTPCLSIGSG
jgi:hypothetical protein